MIDKHIKELVSIAGELDGRGLLREASILDKLAADIIDFEERASALRGAREPQEAASDTSEPGELIDLSERMGGGLRDDFDNYRDEEVDGALRFVENNISPDSKIYDHNGLTDETLGDYAYSNSQELKDYMLEVIPDKLYDLASDVKEPKMEEVLRLVRDVAESLPKYEDDEDFKYLVDAMFYYLKEFSF
jgi:hypothetical protein